jgi:hypothetical protein
MNLKVVRYRVKLLSTKQNEENSVFRYRLFKICTIEQFPIVMALSLKSFKPNFSLSYIIGQIYFRSDTYFKNPELS